MKKAQYPFLRIPVLFTEINIMANLKEIASADIIWINPARGKDP
jgi:hypothetical protein